ncbi:MAG: GreA/GreB family elongation factor, partial [Verrucomicrobiae bacterium]|nr:GreA/GreB family elongation factor [Verrucomicrobiae bacterium]
MSVAQQHHEQIRALLAQGRLEEAQFRWLELSEEPDAQPEFLLTLVKEFADAGHAAVAAELAALIAPSLKQAGKLREWLFALKLRAAACPKDRALRSELAEAYTAIYQTDPRLRAIILAAGLEQDSTPLPEAIGRMDTLLALTPGSYCHQKSWGFGRVKDFDATLQRLIVSFPHNPDHALQLAYAAECLTPVSESHIEVRKQTDLASLKQLASSDPLALLRLALVSYGNSLTPERLEAILTPAVIAPGDWKKWWENTKRLARLDAHFDVPTRKTEPIRLRAVPGRQQDELLEAFRNATTLAQKTEIARQFLRIADEIPGAELALRELQDGLLAALAAAKPHLHAVRIEAAALLDQMRVDGNLLATELAAVANLPSVLDQLSPAAEKRALTTLKKSAPERLLACVNQLDAKALDQIADLLPSHSSQILQSIQNHTASAELLAWVCRNYSTTPWLQPLSGVVLIQAVLSALETAPSKSAGKLYDLLVRDETFLVETLVGAPAESIRDVARRLLASPALAELDRRLLMARLVKEFPFVQELLVQRTVREQPLVVSWASLRRRQAELQELIQKQIPQNSKEIALARSYGDLRENFEYKAAKEMQRVLLRRRAELEFLLLRAQGTDFADAKTDSVNIGTSVTVTDLASGQSATYHILGAWDSDAERNIIS